LTELLKKTMWIQVNQEVDHHWATTHFDSLLVIFRKNSLLLRRNNVLLEGALCALYSHKKRKETGY